MTSKAKVMFKEMDELSFIKVKSSKTNKQTSKKNTNKNFISSRNIMEKDDL